MNEIRFSTSETALSIVVAKSPRNTRSVIAALMATTGAVLDMAEGRRFGTGLLDEIEERQKDAGEAPRVDRDDALDIIEAPNDRQTR